MPAIGITSLYTYIASYVAIAIIYIYIYIYIYTYMLRSSKTIDHTHPYTNNQLYKMITQHSAAANRTT